MKDINSHTITLGVAHLPGRKKPCLVLVEGNVMTKLASFNDDECANLFFNSLLKLTDCDTTND